MHVYTTEERKDQEQQSEEKETNWNAEKEEQAVQNYTQLLPLLKQEGRFEVKVRSANVVKVDWINMRKVGRQ